MDRTPTTSPPASAGWVTEAEGAPAHRVSCTCGYTKRVSGDVEADELLTAHDLAHRLIAGDV